MPSGTSARSMTMKSPSVAVKTAIGVVVEDAVGSLQHAPSMDTMRAPALTSPMNFTATSSASQPPWRMPIQRRRLGQRDEHASAERPDLAFERPLPPIRLRRLFWIGEWTTRQGVFVNLHHWPAAPSSIILVTLPATFYIPGNRNIIIVLESKWQWHTQYLWRPVCCGRSVAPLSVRVAVTT
jgi:hypothetical protein